MLELKSMRTTMTAISPMAKEVFYHPPSSLMPKRTKSGSNGGPSLTVTIPFTFSTRLTRERSRIEDIETRTRTGSGVGVRPQRREPPPFSGRRSKTPSLPKLLQQIQPPPPMQQQHRHKFQEPPTTTSERPSETASKSTTTNSGSLAKRTGSRCEQNPLTSRLKERAETGEVAASSNRDDLVETVLRVDYLEADEEELGENVLSPLEYKERRLNEAKCRQWLQGLPAKFSGMHIVQQTLYTAHR